MVHAIYSESYTWFIFSPSGPIFSPYMRVVTYSDLIQFIFRAISAPARVFLDHYASIFRAKAGLFLVRGLPIFRPKPGFRPGFIWFASYTA